MTTVGRKGEGPRDDGMTEERSSARDRAHWLVKEVQDRVPGAADEVTALIARARNSSWPEVLRAALYADAVARLVANDGNFRQAVDRLRQQAELDGEPVMEALALALGSWNEIDGGDPEAPWPRTPTWGVQRSCLSWPRAWTNATRTSEPAPISLLRCRTGTGGSGSWKTSNTSRPRTCCYPAKRSSCERWCCSTRLSFK